LRFFFLAVLSVLPGTITTQDATASPPGDVPVDFISPEDCAAYVRKEVLWLGGVGISGLEGVALPGHSGLRELGLNQMAAIKFFMDGSLKTTGVYSNGSTVEFAELENADDHANGDPRRALVAATEVCTHPEAQDRTLGFFGGISSDESKAVQLVASTFGFVQVSPVSEGQELSDKNRYPTFNRVFTPSFKLAPAIIDVILRFGWKKIGIVAGETPEDFSAVRSLETVARDAGISIASVVKPVSDKPEDMEDLVRQMNEEQFHIRVWVMYFTVCVTSPLSACSQLTPFSPPSLALQYFILAVSRLVRVNPAVHDILG